MAELRFYAELNCFLAPALRGRSFVQQTAPHETLKHILESLGVPHTEVGGVLLNGEPVGLEHRPLAEGDRVSVFPSFRSPDFRSAFFGTAPPPRPLRFLADAHLGRLARYLRFAGYDTFYDHRGKDAELAARARAEERVLLTRDRDLLMHREVLHGCYLHAIDPLEQFTELARRLHLSPQEDLQSRCLVCNTLLQAVAKADIAHRLLPRTREQFNAFWRCDCCDRVFWRGSHWERLRRELGVARDRKEDLHEVGGK